MQRVDVTVLGGGIAGLGVADACTRRGLSTAVIEAGTAGNATSNNTLRIIHGGLRYLQHLNLPRVVRSLDDQTYVARTFPDFVTPLACLMPLAQRGLKSRAPLSMASLLYGAMMRARSSPLARPEILSASEVAALSPVLSTVAPHGALRWYDCVMSDPSGIHSALISTVLSRGATLHEHQSVASVTRTEHGFSTQTRSGLVCNSRAVISTLGPWHARLASAPTSRISPPLWCLGFNLTINQQLHPSHAFGVQSPDGRLFFCVPRGSHTTIGTWYLACSQPCAAGDTPPLKPEVPEPAIESFIASFNKALPALNMTRSDICAIDAGVLPMKSVGPKGPNLFGSEQITSERGYCEVLSTKYTTFRSQGERAAHLIWLWLQR